jgi:hypothetical protein
MSNNFITPPSHRLPTLFPSQREAYRALDVCIGILQGDEIKKDPQGFCLISDLCEEIKRKDDRFGYLNQNHIIEFFFKDNDRKILISGIDKIKYKDIKFVKPPEYLYFGTVENLLYKMRLQGIRSITKGYVKLFETPERACEFSEKFAREGEKTAALKINTGKAFSEGLKFSTFNEGEYIVAQVISRYII